jgi:hypothetical protein
MPKLGMREVAERIRSPSPLGPRDRPSQWRRSVLQEVEYVQRRDLRNSERYRLFIRPGLVSPSYDSILLWSASHFSNTLC